MRSAFQTFLALVVSFVAATAVITLTEAVNGRVLYPELGKLAEGVTDRDAIRQLLAGAPVGALLVVLAGWALGTFVGAWIAAWIGRRAPAAHALAVGGLIALAGIANNLMMPPPLWFWAAGLAVPVAAAYAAARLVGKSRATVPPA
jgi:hypothetical protein